MLCPSCGRDNSSDAQFCNRCGANLDASKAEPPATAEESAVLTSGSFVGRQQEMADLREALEDARSGRGRLVMLVGEPGIGKSRAAREIGTYAELRGSRILWGRCYEEQGTPAYWPWIQAIRAYVREQDGESIRAAMGPGASDIAAIIPDLREKLPDLKLAPDLEPEQARFRLFDSIATFFRNSARTRPRCSCWSSWPGRWRIVSFWWLGLIRTLSYRALTPSRRPWAGWLGSGCSSESHCGVSGPRTWNS